MIIMAGLPRLLIRLERAKPKHENARQRNAA